jgi:MFS family permease
MVEFKKDLQYYKFSSYGFLKNLRFFDPYLILYFREVGLSFFQIGVLFGVREIGTNLLEIPTGVIADSFGRRRAMMGAFLSYIFSFAVFFFFPSFYVYIGAMIFFSVGEALRSGTHKAMILDYLKRKGMEKQKVHYYGHTRSWSQRGSALSALIAGFIVFFSGSYREVFLYSIIPYILGFFLIRSYPTYLDFSVDAGKAGAEGGGEGARAVRGTEVVVKKVGFDLSYSVRSTLEEFRSMLKHATLRRLLFNSSLFDGIFKTVKDYIQPIMQNLALTLPILVSLADRERVAVVVGVLYFLLYIFTSMVAQNSGKTAERFSSPQKGLDLTYILNIFMVAAVGLSMIYALPQAAVVFFIGLYVLQNLRRPITLGFVSENIKGTVMATGLSVESQLKTLMVAVLAPVFGAMADSLGLGWALCILAVLPLAVYPVVRLSGREEK